jgi:enoyl-CoA hydratase/carnithine racemase
VKAWISQTATVVVVDSDHPSSDESTPEHAPVTMEHHGGVAVIRLDRPTTRNAFTAEMGHLLDTAYRECDGDDDVRVVVVTGAGDAFCAGADFSRGSSVFSSPDSDEFRSDPFRFPAWRVRKPVIAAINGHAVGIGLTLALQCDLRVIAHEAKWGVVQTRRGVVGDCRVHWTLPRLVGVSRATEILLGGALYTGEQALHYGIAHRAVPASEVMTCAMEWAFDIARYTAPLSVAASKQMLWRGVDEASGGAGIDAMERDWHLRLMGAADAREGVDAFLDRRDPRWTGSVAHDWPEPTD